MGLSGAEIDNELFSIVEIFTYLHDKSDDLIIPLTSNMPSRKPNANEELRKMSALFVSLNIQAADSLPGNMNTSLQENVVLRP
jgi:hypothetical protein